MKPDFNQPSTRNFVYVTFRDGDKRYLFELPYHAMVNKGNTVFVKARYGNEVVVTCVTDNFSLPNETADILLSEMGLYKMKWVTGRAVQVEYKKVEF